MGWGSAPESNREFGWKQFVSPKLTHGARSGGVGEDGGLIWVGFIFGQATALFVTGGIALCDRAP